jgi:hypothetical protein
MTDEQPIDWLTAGEVLALAEVYYERTGAGQLLSRAGLPHPAHPHNPPTALQYWEEVNDVLRRGKLPGGRRRILVAALDAYPANRHFRAGRAAAEQAEAAVDHSEQAAEYSGTGPSAGASAEAGAQTDQGSGWEAADTETRLPETVTVVAVDAVGYSSQLAQVQQVMRTGLNRIVHTAFQGARVPRAAVRLQDTGDGFLITIASTVSKAIVAAEFVERLRVALSNYNLAHDGAARLRLRLALHHGDVIHDRTGWAGSGVIVGARLVDSPPIRDAIEENANADLALIVSSTVYDTVIKERYLGINPDLYRQVDVRMKKFEGSAWLTLPGYAATIRAADTGASGGSAGRGARPGARPGADGVDSTPAVSEWDFFISVADQDLSWGGWITSDLEREGYKVNLEAWDVQGGDVGPGALDDAIRFSTRTIVVLTPAYLESPKVRAAWGAAWNSDPNGTRRRVIPVRIKNCEPDGLLGSIKYIDLVGLPEHQAREHLHEQIRRSVKGFYRPDTPPAFPGDNR